MVNKEIHDNVFKIFTEHQWKRFQESSHFKGSPDDLRDGFIHLCTREQVASVIERFFAGQHPLYVAEFSNSEFLQQITWEASASGEIYPHLYGRALFVKEISGFTKL